MDLSNTTAGEVRVGPPASCRGRGPFRVETSKTRQSLSEVSSNPHTLGEFLPRDLRFVERGHQSSVGIPVQSSRLRVILPPLGKPVRKFHHRFSLVSFYSGSLALVVRPPDLADVRWMSGRPIQWRQEGINCHCT